MTPGASPDSVLAAISGWAGARHTELLGGLSNRSYLVEHRGRRAVLKIDAAPPQPPLNRREDEARIQSVAARAGLAARVLHVSPVAYLTEYVDGIAWSRETLLVEANLVALAGTLKKLHGLPPSGRVFDARGAARAYAAQIGTVATEDVTAALRKVEALQSPRTLCLCHNDLVAANIVGNGALRLIDWEYACDNDPLFDLATVVAHHDLPGPSARLLLDSYFDGRGERWYDALAEYAAAYKALVYLWEQARR